MKIVIIVYRCLSFAAVRAYGSLSVFDRAVILTGIQLFFACRAICCAVIIYNKILNRQCLSKLTFKLCCKRRKIVCIAFGFFSCHVAPQKSSRLSRSSCSLPLSASVEVLLLLNPPSPRSSVIVHFISAPGK